MSRIHLFAQTMISHDVSTLLAFTYIFPALATLMLFWLVDPHPAGSCEQNKDHWAVN